jgi:hypothetical protein
MANGHDNEPEYTPEERRETETDRDRLLFPFGLLEQPLGQEYTNVEVERVNNGINAYSVSMVGSNDTVVPAVVRHRFEAIIGQIDNGTWHITAFELIPTGMRITVKITVSNDPMVH